MAQASSERMRTAMSLWSWAEMLVVAATGLVPLSAIHALNRHDPTRARAGRFFRQMGVAATRLCPMWDLGVHGELPKQPPGRTVVICNHWSQADPFLISYLPWEMKWLSKASIMKTPLIGWAMRLAGDIPVKRGTRESARQAMERCREYLEQDMPVMIFPEGTRSRDDDMLPFKDGAFRLAIETGADILPLALAGTRTALPKHSWKLGYCRALVTVGDPIPTQGMTLDDVPALRERCRGEVARLRDALLPHASL